MFAAAATAVSEFVAVKLIKNPGIYKNPENSKKESYSKCTLKCSLEMRRQRLTCFTCRKRAAKRDYGSNDDDADGCFVLV